MNLYYSKEDDQGFAFKSIGKLSSNPSVAYDLLKYAAEIVKKIHNYSYRGLDENDDVNPSRDWRNDILVFRKQTRLFAQEFHRIDVMECLYILKSYHWDLTRSIRHVEYLFKFTFPEPDWWWLKKDPSKYKDLADSNGKLDESEYKNTIQPHLCRSYGYCEAVGNQIAMIKIEYLKWNPTYNEKIERFSTIASMFNEGYDPEEYINRFLSVKPALLVRKEDGSLRFIGNTKKERGVIGCYFKYLKLKGIIKQDLNRVEIARILSLNIENFKISGSSLDSISKVYGNQFKSQLEIGSNKS